MFHQPQLLWRSCHLAEQLSQLVNQHFQVAVALVTAVAASDQAAASGLVLVASEMVVRALELV